MRKSILLPLLLAACSGDGEDATFRVVEDFHARSTPVTCSTADLGEVAVEELRLVTDTTFLVLDAAQRRLAEYDEELRLLWTLEYPEHGPAAVESPVSATLIGDSAVAILDRGGLKLVILDRAGDLIRAEPLTFIPHSMAALGDDVLVTAVPLGASPEALLFRLRGAEMEALPVPPRPYTDMMVGTLGNSTIVETFPEGSALVVHQFLAPRAFHVDLDGDTVSPLPVPTPDATAGLVEAVPRAPITEDQFGDLLVPALAMSLDRTRREVYLLTRSGRLVDGRRERALLRLDDGLGYLESYLLDAHAVRMVVLPRRRAAVVTDDLDRPYLCPLDADTRAE